MPEEQNEPHKKDTKPWTQSNWWIILNPAAGNGKCRRLRPAIEACLRKNGFTFTLVETERRGHAIQLVEEGIQKGFRQIIAVGGDGTNNEVINGIMQQQSIPSTDIVYTLIPVGTGNDWIKTHGIPNHYNKWIPRIATAQLVCQDIGLVSYYKDGQPAQQYFANIAGLAYDAYLTKVKSEKSPRILPTIYYLYLVLVYLFKYQLRRAKVIFDGEDVEDYFYTINIGVCRYSGGGMQFVPHAVPDDGRFAMTIARKVSKLDVLLYTPNIFAGTLDNHPQVTSHYATSVRVEPMEARPTLVEVDGEFLGEAPAEFSLLKKRLHLLRP